MTGAGTSMGDSDSCGSEILNCMPDKSDILRVALSSPALPVLSPARSRRNLPTRIEVNLAVEVSAME